MKILIICHDITISDGSIGKFISNILKHLLS